MTTIPTYAAFLADIWGVLLTIGRVPYISLKKFSNVVKLQQVNI
jgi:hypothetical protein